MEYQTTKRQMEQENMEPPESLGLKVLAGRAAHSHLVVRKAPGQGTDRLLGSSQSHA